MLRVFVLMLTMQGENNAGDKKKIGNIGKIMEYNEKKK